MIAFIVGAILTPSPDVVSQVMMATPMILLYNFSIVLAWRVTVRREAREKILRDKERLADEAERAERARRRAAGETIVDDDDEDEYEDDDE